MKSLIKWISKNGLDDLSLLSTVTVFAISIGVSFLSQALLGNSLGLEGFGHFSSAYAKAAILSGVLTWGLDISALKFASSYFQSGNRKQFDRFVVHSVALTIFSSIAFVFFWFVAHKAGLGFVGEVTPMLAYTIAFWTTTRLLAALLRTVGQQALSLVVDRIVRDGFLAVVCLLAYAGILYPLTLASALYALGIGCGIGLLISLVAFGFGHRPVPGDMDGIPASRLEWASTSLSLWSANVLELAFSRAEVIILALFGQATNAGLFAVLLAISNLLYLPVLALNVVFQPRFAALNVPGKEVLLRQEARRFVLAGLPITLLIGVGVLIEPRFFLALFGARGLESESVWCLGALVVVRMALAPTGSRAPILQMNEGHFTLAKILLGGLLLKIVLLITPTSSLSMIWVTTVSVASMLFVQLAIFFFSQKLLSQLRGKKTEVCNRDDLRDLAT